MPALTLSELNIVLSVLGLRITPRAHQSVLWH